MNPLFNKRIGYVDNYRYHKAEMESKKDLYVNKIFNQAALRRLLLKKFNIYYKLKNNDRYKCFELNFPKRVSLKKDLNPLIIKLDFGKFVINGNFNVKFKKYTNFGMRMRNFWDNNDNDDDNDRGMVTYKFYRLKNEIYLKIFMLNDNITEENSLNYIYKLKIITPVSTITTKGFKITK